MITSIRFLALLVLALPMASALPAIDAESGSLTLEQAIARSLERGPQMLGVAADRVVADARVQGARAWPTPTLDIASENMLGSGPFSGFDSAETTIAIAQDLPLGGQRSAAVSSACAGQEAAAAQQQLVRLELQRARAEVEAGSAQATARRATLHAMSARRPLAQFWREDTLTESLDTAWFDSIVGLSANTASLGQHPQRFKARAELTQAQAQLVAECAKRIPVVTAAFAVRRFAEAMDGEDQAFVLGLSLPLPFGDRNGEAIADARVQVLRAELAAHRAQAALSVLSSHSD